MFSSGSLNTSSKREQSKNQKGGISHLDSEHVGICKYTNAAASQRGAILNHRLVEQCVENLCRKGCRAVWSDLDALEDGEIVPEAEGLSSAEVNAVVTELREVMAVYEGTCAVG